MISNINLKINNYYASRKKNDNYICAWEYDEVQFYDPDFEGGTNDTSLNQAKENFRLYNISDPSLQNWKNNNIKKTAYLNSRKWHC